MSDSYSRPVGGAYRLLLPMFMSVIGAASASQRPSNCGVVGNVCFSEEG